MTTETSPATEILTAERLGLEGRPSPGVSLCQWDAVKARMPEVER